MSLKYKESKRSQEMQDMVDRLRIAYKNIDGYKPQSISYRICMGQNAVFVDGKFLEQVPIDAKNYMVKPTITQVGHIMKRRVKP